MHLCKYIKIFGEHSLKLTFCHLQFKKFNFRFRYFSHFSIYLQFKKNQFSLSLLFTFFAPKNSNFSLKFYGTIRKYIFLKYPCGPNEKIQWPFKFSDCPLKFKIVNLPITKINFQPRNNNGRNFNFVEFQFSIFNYLLLFYQSLFSFPIHYFREIIEKQNWSQSNFLPTKNKSKN